MKKEFLRTGLKKYFSPILFLMVIAIFSSTTSKNPGFITKPLSSPPVLSNIDNIVLEEMALQEIVGCAVGVVKNGNIVHVKGYGYMDLEQTKPVTENTIFRWASISKTLTAVATFKAIEDRKLTLNDKVKDKVSYWPSTGDKGNITVAHLLNNRSGIVHYGENEKKVKICSYNKSAYKSFNNFNAEQAVNVFKDCKLAFTPGTKYLYSSFGFNLLGAVVEKATGVPYEQYVQDNIAKIAGMTNLKPYANDPGGFTKNCDDELIPVTEGVVEWKLPSGGWSSSVYDMTRFLEGLIDGKFLRNTSSLWQTVANNSSYAFGTYRTDYGSTIYVQHGGVHNDVRTYLSFFPGTKNGVCVMINGASYVNRERLARKIDNAMGFINWSSSNVSPLPMDYCGNSAACGDGINGVWRKTNNTDMLIRKGYTHDNFYKMWNGLIKLGYHCADFETYLDGNVRKWDGVFKKGASGSAMWRGMDMNGFNTKWQQMNASGYRLIDIETYLDGSNRKWAGLFIKSSEPYALWRGMTTSDFGTKNTAMANAGYKLIDIESYMDGQVQKWAGVWLGKGSYLLNRNYATSAFTSLCNSRNAAGWRLVDVETDMIGSERKWAGVWEKSSQPEYYQFGKKCCDFIGKHQSYLNAGFELIDIGRY
ncbi:MAG: serine hydrolase [Terrimonas sp.]|nr:serine hydrolase [Terrimonas sp.]